MTTWLRSSGSALWNHVSPKAARRLPDPVLKMCSEGYCVRLGFSVSCVNSKIWGYRVEAERPASRMGALVKGRAEPVAQPATRVAEPTCGERVGVMAAEDYDTTSNTTPAARTRPSTLPPAGACAHVLCGLQTVEMTGLAPAFACVGARPLPVGLSPWGLLFFGGEPAPAADALRARCAMQSQELPRVKRSVVRIRSP
jgi:hypothetical protein